MQHTLGFKLFIKRVRGGLYSPYIIPKAFNPFVEQVREDLYSSHGPSLQRLILSSQVRGELHPHRTQDFPNAKPALGQAREGFVPT